MVSAAEQECGAERKADGSTAKDTRQGCLMSATLGGQNAKSNTSSSSNNSSNGIKTKKSEKGLL